MENEEMLEQTNDTENVDTQTTEEIGEGIELTDTSEAVENTEEEKEEVKSFTQEEVDAIVQKRLARKEREYQRELSKYKNVENVLNAGLGTESIDEADTKLREFYKEQGVELPAPTKPGLSDSELQLLGTNDADEFLELGLDEAEKEANRLAQKGYQNLNAREEAEFNKLARTLTYEKQKKELKSIGADSKILDSQEFQDFKNQFNASANIKDIYSLYSKTQSKENKNIEKMGSMKNNPTNEIKDFYTYEESLKFTREDFDKNPELFKAIENSMSKW